MGLYKDSSLLNLSVRFVSSRYSARGKLVFDILSTVIHLALAGALAAPIEYNR